MNAPSKRREAKDRLIVVSLISVAEMICALGLIMEYAPKHWLMPALFGLLCVIALLVYGLAEQWYLNEVNNADEG